MKQLHWNGFLMAMTVFVAALMPAVAWPLTIQVSPDGPATTLEQAREAIRQRKAQGALTEPIRVVISRRTLRAHPALHPDARRQRHRRGPDQL